MISGFSKEYEGKHLLKIKLPNKSSEIVDVICEFMGVKEKFQARVVGFWNKKDSCYHFYVTNLVVASELIYPLYRLRWQIELVFKATKRSFQLGDISSANPAIIKNLVLVVLVATLVTFPLTKDFACEEEVESRKMGAITVQRMCMFGLHIAREMRGFLLMRSKKFLNILRNKMVLFLQEIFEPNYKKRETSQQRVLSLVSLLL